MADELIHHPVEDDPAVYTRRPPTPEEHLLAELCNGHDGAHVPLHFFTKIAVRLKRLGQWAGGWDDLFRKIRRNSRVSLASLITIVATAGGFVLHRVASEATAAERAAAQERAEAVYREGVQRGQDRLERELEYLRRRLDRLTGVEPSGPSGDYHDMYPDKLSLLKGPTCTFASHYPQP